MRPCWADSACGDDSAALTPGILRPGSVALRLAVAVSRGVGTCRADGPASLARRPGGAGTPGPEPGLGPGPEGSSTGSLARRRDALEHGGQRRPASVADGRLDSVAGGPDAVAQTPGAAAQPPGGLPAVTSPCWAATARWSTSADAAASSEPLSFRTEACPTLAPGPGSGCTAQGSALAAAARGSAITAAPGSSLGPAAPASGSAAHGSASTPAPLVSVSTPAPLAAYGSASTPAPLVSDAEPSAGAAAELVSSPLVCAAPPSATAELVSSPLVFDGEWSALATAGPASTPLPSALGGRDTPELS